MIGLYNINKVLLSLYTAVALLFINSCGKTEDVLIPNNQPPPDSTINNITKENYVNRLYISVLGRKCTDEEYGEANVILVNNKLSIDSRKQVFDIVAAKPGYYERLMKIAETDFLNSADSSLFSYQMGLYQQYLGDITHQSEWAAINYEAPRLQLLIDAVADMESGETNVIGMHRRCVSNYLYDFINMGTQNFVISIYQNFFRRYPSQSELDAGVACINGHSATVFYQVADNKELYLDLFFASDNYFEGQVRDLFTRYLYREPTSEEQGYYTERYKSNQNYKSLQRDILTLDEFVGL